MPTNSFAAAKEFRDQLDRLLAAARQAGIHYSEIAGVLDERAVAVRMSPASLMRPEAAATPLAPVTFPIAQFPAGYSNSNAKMRFQSFFMLITVQPSFFASS